MAKYLLKRLGMAVLTLFVILLLLFIMVHSLPGSPFNNAEKLTEAQKAAMNAKYGLDKPLLTQFFIYFSNVLKGDFGTSYSFASDIPISTILKGRVSTSFKIGGLSVLIGAVIGLFIGITAALNRDKFMDTFCTVLSIVALVRIHDAADESSGRERRRAARFIHAEAPVRIGGDAGDFAEPFHRSHDFPVHA